MIVSVNFGIILCFIAGAFLQFVTIPLIMIVFPCLYFILLFLILPDTPNSLLKHHKEKEAKESLMFYRSCKSNAANVPEKVNIEFNALKMSFEKPLDQESSEKLSWNDFS